MFHKLLSEPPTRCDCSGGKGKCLNEPVAVVETGTMRSQQPYYQKRELCRRCLSIWLARHVMARSFDPPQWAIDLIVLPRERQLSSPAIAAADRNVIETAADTEVLCSTK